MTSGNGSAAKGLPPRPRFFEGQLVRHGDLEAGESHAFARHRRHALHLHGCGVVCGLLVELEIDPDGEQVLVVAPGFAVDGAGHELELGEATSARLGEVCYLTGPAEARATGRWPPDGGDVCALGPLADQRYYLALCYAEATFCPVPAYPDQCGGTLRTEPARRQDRPHLVLLDALGDADCVGRNPRLEDPDWIASYYLFEPGDGEAPPEFPLETDPDLVRAELALSRRWTDAEPPAADLRGNNLLVRWRRRGYFNAGRYQFRLESDGGARLWVGDQPVIDDWASGASRTRTSALVLAPGVHEIRVEYFHETGAAIVDLIWQPLETGWHARFHPYPEQDAPPEIPAGAPTAIWIESALALQLEGGDSFPDLPQTHFILRLVRDIEITAPGLYTFTAHTDDGMRIRIDGETVLDSWIVQAPTRHEPRVMLDPGPHRVEVDFFQRRGFAVAKLAWRRVGPYNPTCRPPRLPGCVVLAAFDVRAGAIRPETLQNFALDVAHGFERAVLPSAEVLGRARATLGSDDPR
ncbi:MAG: PA14 domain-containing protein, partial [Geminicoccaceae bacterium]